MNDVVALGEVLVDFTYAGRSAAGMRLFEQNPGGAPANVLTALSRLGLKTAFIGKVGDDMHGLFLKQVLDGEGIDTGALLVDRDYFTTLAFVSLADNGERTFSFARKPGADTMLRKEEVPEALIREAKIFHLGSLSLTNEPAKTATFFALETAKKAGCVISYDPNYRAPLWESREKAMKGMRSVLPYADVIKLSDEETDLLTPYQEPEQAGKYLIENGAKAVVVTLGKKGACVVSREGCKYELAFPNKAVDATGAGDSFWGGVLYSLLHSGKRMEEIGLSDLAAFAHFGNAVASLCVEKRGGIPAMPYLAEVQERLKQQP